MHPLRTIFGINTSPQPLPLKEKEGWESPDPPHLVSSGAISSRARARAFVGVIFATLLFFMLGVRLGELQIVQGDTYRMVADANRLRSVREVAHRGRLFSRDGVVLAQNMPAYRLLGYRSLLPTTPDELSAHLGLLSISCGIPFDGLFAAFQEAERMQQEEFLLTNALSSSCALQFLAGDDLPEGVRLEVGEQRSYITDKIPSLSHVLGYTAALSEKEYAFYRDQGYRSFDSVGKQGIEQLFERELHGSDGEQLVEVDARGGILRTLVRREPLQGNDLTVSLDASLHAHIEQVLAKYLAQAPVARAAVAVMQPQTGEILALVSYPTYDANAFTQGISQDAYSALVNDPSAPLFNRCIAGSYPAGSVMKPLYAAGGLTDGTISPSTTFTSVGGLWLGDRFFPDWRAGGHGVTDVYHAIADSVNTYFYALGGGVGDFTGMGVERLMDWARVFGLGSVTGSGLSGESAGFLPSKTWKEETKGEPWYIGDTYNVAIGQGDVLVTPLQMVRAISALAIGGELVTPVFLKDAQGEKVRVVREDIAEEIRIAMRETVTAGTARMMQDLPVEVAGKTGTAQWSSAAPAHSWFTGFAPYDNPQVAIAVIVEQGGDLTLASFVAHDVLEGYFAEDTVLDSR